MSKGSTRRPTQLTQAEIAERWAQAFGGVGERQQPGGARYTDKYVNVFDLLEAMEYEAGRIMTAKMQRGVEAVVFGESDVDDQC